MNWLEISIDAHGDPEALCAQLTELGVESFVIEDEKDFKSFLEENTQYWDFVDDKLEQDFRGISRVKLWVSDDDEGSALAAKLHKLGLSPAVKKVQDADWENNWRDFYKPVEIGKRLVVVPEWETYDGDRVPVKLDPGLLFGTGDHPTTQMCLAAVEQYAAPGVPVLDIGCGSGILGVAAAVLGAKPVVAADVDEKAPEVVGANAALNGVDGVFTVYVGDVIASERLRKKLGGGYGLVLANIVADVIIPLAPYAPGFMAEDGVFVCSGVIDGREDEVAGALQAAGLHILRHDHKEEWHCFLCGKERAK